MMIHNALLEKRGEYKTQQKYQTMTSWMFQQVNKWFGSMG